MQVYWFFFFLQHRIFCAAALSKNKQNNNKQKHYSYVCEYFSDAKQVIFFITFFPLQLQELWQTSFGEITAFIINIDF